MTPSRIAVAAATAAAPYTPLVVGGFAILLMGVVLQDAFEVMLLPRRVHRRVRFTRFYFRAIWSAWTAVSRLMPNADDGRERFLAVFGPLSMLALIAAWSALLIAAFGLLQWVLQGHAQPHSAPLEQIYMSGVTFFTLGYGDIVPHSGPARAAAVVEAGTGLGFLAVVIGYLPVLYQLFSRREAHVIQLDARAGSPPTAAAMLIRHADGLDKLDQLLREWEFWGADLLESHLSYPMLVYYRSQHDNQSWLAAVAAIMDTCALILVGIADMNPLQARMTFTIIRQVVVEMARSLAIPPSRYDGGDRLPPTEYVRLQASLSEARLAWNGDEHARETLAALRATYEPLLDGLARKLLLPLPGWIPHEGATDNWQSGHRGTLAGRLIAQLAERQSDTPEPAPDDPLWRRMRTRLGRKDPVE